MFRFMTNAVPFLLFLAGCAGSGPESSRFAQSVASKTGVVVYWQCLVDIPGAGSASVYIDGKKVGDISPCRYRHFPATPGKHTIRFAENFGLDFSGAFGLQGPSFQVPNGQPLFVRLRRTQYLESNAVSNDVGSNDIAGMSPG